ncbi:MAG: TIGR01906 family membrane protein [Caldicoprobacterales bacterium]
MNKASSCFFTGLLGITAVLLLITGLFISSIMQVAFDMDFYDREYKKLDISQSTGMSQQHLLNTTKELLNYLKDKRDDLNISAIVHGKERLVFNQREIDHMVDVKELFTLGFRLRWISFGFFGLIVVLLLWLKGKAALRTLSISYLTVLAIFAVLFIVLLILMSMDFTAVWNGFHYIAFSNDLWILDPETDILIQMVPEPFFYDTVIRILSIFGTALAVLAILSIIMLLKSARRRRINR